jgi:hypothetical protein
MLIDQGPTGRKVEATVAVFAFESWASNVLIRTATIEKYASVAQKGLSKPKKPWDGSSRTANCA